MSEDFKNKFRDKWDEGRNRWEEKWEARMERHDGHGHIWTGVFILLIGVAAMVKATVTDLPNWVFSWQTFLIALGLFIGFKHNFKSPSWFILIIIGSVFLVRDIYPDLAIRRYIWPAALIAVGAFLILKPRSSRQWYCGDNQKKKQATSSSGIEEATIVEETYENQQDFREDYVDTTSFFGGAKKNIISKNFRGGDVVNVFGGTELDLTRADIKGTAVIEITTIFGGTKLVVPSNWTIKSEAVTIFGGLEDKRNTQNLSDNAEKILLLKGTVIFGGIEIKSF